MNVKIEIVNGKIKVYHGMFLSCERKVIQQKAVGLKDGVHIVKIKKEELN